MCCCTQVRLNACNCGSKGGLPEIEIAVPTPPLPEWASKDRYKQLLEERGLNVAYPGDVTDWHAIRFAAAWKPPPGLLAQVRSALPAALAQVPALPALHRRRPRAWGSPAAHQRAAHARRAPPQCRNLEAAMSLGAGVDHILQPGQVPERVPILRIVSARGRHGADGGRCCKLLPAAPRARADPPAVHFSARSPVLRFAPFRPLAQAPNHPQPPISNPQPNQPPIRPTASPAGRPPHGGAHGHVGGVGRGQLAAPL